jgi:hypothetical protein
VYIDFASLWKLLNIDAVSDWEKRAVTFHIGSFCMEKVPLLSLKSLAADPLDLETVVDTLFVRHSAMWEDLSAENPRKVEEGLKQLYGEAQIVAEEFRKSSQQVDRDISSTIQTWAELARGTAKQIDNALESDLDPTNTGVDGLAREVMNGAVVELRIKCFPFVEFLVTLLPENDEVAAQALDLLMRGKDILVRKYLVEPSRVPKLAADLCPL